MPWPRRLFPTRLLMGAVALTLLLIGALAWQVAAAQRTIEAALTHDARLYELRGVILHLDELLTMSARMAALTGDPAWAARYDAHAPELDAAIHAALAAVPQSLRRQIGAETDAANVRLIELEGRAFSLVAAGRRADAAALLGGAEYAQQKRRYTQGMDRLLAYIQEQAAARLEASRSRATLLTAAVGVALPLLAGVWAVVLRTLRASIAARGRVLVLQAEEQTLAQTLRDREAQIAERTAALQRALVGVQAREAELQATVQALATSQSALRELSAPVLPISPTQLVMPLVGALDGARLEVMQQQALRAVEARRARSLILDVTGVPLIDAEVARGILDLVRALRLMGVETALAGIRPEVAQTIVGMGIGLDGLRTYSGLQSALQPRGAAR